MIYFIYILLVPISLLLTLVALLIAPILPFFAAMQYGQIDNGSAMDFEPRLPVWLSWFQTPDNSLWGDQTFKQNNPIGYWSEVKWYDDTFRLPTDTHPAKTLTDKDCQKLEELMGEYWDISYREARKGISLSATANDCLNRFRAILRKAKEK